MDHQNQVKEIAAADDHSNGFNFGRSMINLYERQSSVSHSSRIYFPSISQGVPFQWEMQPGTSKDPPENDVLPPLTPPPALHSARLPPRPPPNGVVHDHHHRSIKAEFLSNRWRTWLDKKNRSSRRSSKKLPNDHESSSRFSDANNGGSLMASTASSLHDSCSSSFSSSWASSSCSYFPAAESWDMAKILGDAKEDNNCICNACKNDTNGFALGKNISRDSSANQPSSRMYYRDLDGVAFQWEEQPGKSKEPHKQVIIPPPSPPPAMQSHGLPKPGVHDHAISSPVRRPVWFWKKKKSDKNQQNEIMHQRNISFIDRHGSINLLGTSRATTTSVMHLWSSWKKMRRFGDILGGLIRKPA